MSTFSGNNSMKIHTLTTYSAANTEGIVDESSIKEIKPVTFQITEEDIMENDLLTLEVVETEPQYKDVITQGDKLLINAAGVKGSCRMDGTTFFGAASATQAATPNQGYQGTDSNDKAQ